MGGLFGGSSAPKPLPTPARPVTAVAKTPELELDDTAVETGKDKRRKRGKKALKIDLAKEGSETSGVQVATE